MLILVLMLNWFSCWAIILTLMYDMMMLITDIDLLDNYTHFDMYHYDIDNDTDRIPNPMSTQKIMII